MEKTRIYIKSIVIVSAICFCATQSVYCRDFSAPETKRELENRVIQKVVRTFFLGIFQNDSGLIQQSIIPNANAKVLWSEEELPVYIKETARKLVAHLSMMQLEPGDTIHIGRYSMKITKDHVNKNQRLVAIEMAGMNNLLYVRKYRGQWRLDANLFISMYVWSQQ